MDDVDLVRHQYSYDPETGVWLWRNPPLKTRRDIAEIGKPAGTVDKRDGSLKLTLDGKIHRASRLAWLYVYGEWPDKQVLYRDPGMAVPEKDRLSNLRLASEAEDLTQERVRAIILYDETTGEMRWRVSRKGVSAGAIAASLKNVRSKGAYLYVRIDGVDYPAQRVAWLWMTGRLPTSRIRFKDDNPQNIAFDNLVESGFEHGTRETPTISDDERRVRQAATYRRSDLMRTFGLTVEQYQVMHDAQGGKCAICGEAETAERGGKTKWLAVDHDHKDGRVRELLCAACNVGLGNFADDPARLRAAAAYLERHADGVAEEDAA